VENAGGDQALIVSCAIIDRRKMEAVSYMRCSGESQVLGDTWERQRAVIVKYAAANEIAIVDEFRDEGVTGKMELEGRAGLSACIQFIREKGIKLVLVESSDRLARDMIVAEVVVREFQKIGVRVISASGGIDLTEGDDSNPTAKLIRQILAAVAEFDRCVIVLKLRGARQRKKARGERGDGRHAFGEKPGEAIVLAQIRALKAQGETTRAIAGALNATAIPTRMGGTWKAGTVAKILAREKFHSACA
jgi:DNA invertase Pin-like site-specific DNA recombinase